jgi:hypothetical protein
LAEIAVGLPFAGAHTGLLCTPPRSAGVLAPNLFDGPRRDPTICRAHEARCTVVHRVAHRRFSKLRTGWLATTGRHPSRCRCIPATSRGVDHDRLLPGPVALHRARPLLTGAPGRTNPTCNGSLLAALSHRRIRLGTDIFSIESTLRPHRP